MSETFDEKTLSRFWAKVDTSAGADSCWPWTAARVTNGYGAFSVGGVQKLAHRVSWEIENGPVPPGACVLHSCDRPRCVNVKHLRTGTPKDNTDDMDARGRRVTLRGSDRPGAALTDSEVIAMRTRYAAGGITQKELGAQYGVNDQNVSFIVRGVSWAHVGGPLTTVGRGFRA